MSGLVKGVKKVFKAIGNGIKKLASSTLGKILLGAAAIFTGGFALGAFGAMGTAGATFGSVMSAGLAGGVAPFSAAMSAITGATSSIGSSLGLTTAGAEGGAMAAAAAEAAAPGAASWAGAGATAAESSALFAGGEAIAGGAAVAEGAAGIGASGGIDAMGAYAAEAAAPGTASWGAAAEPFSLANAGGGYAPVEAGVQATQGASQAAFQPELMQQPAAYQAPPMEMVSNTGVAPTMQTVPGNGYATGSGYVPVEEGFTASNAITNSGSAGRGGLWSLWDFVKPGLSSKEGQLLIGQTLMGAARGISYGRQAQEERDYFAARSAVPRNVPRYEAIPGHAAWALNGGK